MQELYRIFTIFRRLFSAEVFAGRSADVFLEAAAEMAVVREADERRDLRYGELGDEYFPRRFFNAVGSEILKGGRARHVLEKLAKIFTG